MKPPLPSLAHGHHGDGSWLAGRVRVAQARRTLYLEAQDMATSTLSGLASPRESRDLVSLSLP